MMMCIAACDDVYCVLVMMCIAACDDVYCCL